MKISINSKDNILTLAVEGRLDANTAGELETAINGNLEGHSKLVLDFSSLSYLASAGLRVILKTYKVLVKDDKSLVVKGANEEVSEVLIITGFADKISMESL